MFKPGDRVQIRDKTKIRYGIIGNRPPREDFNPDGSFLFGPDVLWPVIYEKKEYEVMKYQWRLSRDVRRLSSDYDETWF